MLTDSVSSFVSSQHPTSHYLRSAPHRLKCLTRSKCNSPRSSPAYTSPISTSPLMLNSYVNHPKTTLSTLVRFIDTSTGVLYPKYRLQHARYFHLISSPHLLHPNSLSSTNSNTSIHCLTNHLHGRSTLRTCHNCPNTIPHSTITMVMGHLSTCCESCIRL